MKNTKSNFKECPTMAIGCPYFDGRHCDLTHPEDDCEDYIAHAEEYNQPEEDKPDVFPKADLESMNADELRGYLALVQTMYNKAVENEIKNANTRLVKALREYKKTVSDYDSPSLDITFVEDVDIDVYFDHELIDAIIEALER